MTDTTDTARSHLAVLLAHHADVLAATLRSDARTGLPENRPGVDRAAELLDLHAAHLTAEEEPPAVRELLDSILAFEAERPDLAHPRQVLGTTTGQPCPECGDTGACNGGPCPLTTTGQPETRGLDLGFNVAAWHAERAARSTTGQPATAPTVTRATVLREAANGLAALGPLDSLVSAPAAWAEAIEALRRMADQMAEDDHSRMADEQPAVRCICGETACESELCDCDSAPCPVDHAADEQPKPEAAPETEEQIVREHVTTVHLIGEQLAAVESWLWERLADVRAAASVAEAQQPTPAPAEETK